MMEEAGMDWYEIANFCRPEQICKHNLATWQGHDYLAIGPGAHAFLSTPDYGRRRANPRNLPKYLEQPHAAPWEERDARQAILEALMGGLRIREGFSTRALLERYQIDLDDLLAKHAQPLVEAGYLLLQPAWWQLTPRGAEMLDAILHFLDQYIPAAL
jgi:oxygen-independent coproporphyrinogen-3 oxidase